MKRISLNSGQSNALCLYTTFSFLNEEKPNVREQLEDPSAPTFVFDAGQKVRRVWEAVPLFAHRMIHLHFLTRPSISHHALDH